MNVGDAARVPVPTGPMIDGRWEAEHPGLVVTLVQEVAHAPDRNAAVLDVCKKENERTILFLNNFFGNPNEETQQSRR